MLRKKKKSVVGLLVENSFFTVFKEFCIEEIIIIIIKYEDMYIWFVESYGVCVWVLN